jgi:signal transduction histidine kinase/CheY-like chemotaxis protein/purine-cytosine permease-like protein
LTTPSDASDRKLRQPEEDSQGLGMVATQRIARVRRQYNQWVANQTLEDYALRFTATEARRWSPERVANTALGAISFLALEAIGGVTTLHYGFVNAVTAIVVVSAIIFATSMAIGYHAARYGVDIDLLTRGAGFGYIGSTLSSLIYAIFTFIFFAIEAAIMAQALQVCFGVPLPLGYVVSALLIIPLVTHGITFISRLQLWSQPVWALLQVLPFVFIVIENPRVFGAWRHFAGAVSGAATFDLAWFGAAASVVFSLMAQIGEQVDFLRFLPRRRSPGDLRWWLALIAAGPGWILIGGAKMLAGSLLAVLAVSAGIDIAQAAEPTRMYRVAFDHVFTSPGVALAVTGLFIFLSQIKINVTNAYAGSIAWSNFFSRLTHSHPGRVVWLVFNVLIALMLMQLGVYRTFDRILALYSNLAVAWVGAMVADLVISKWLGLSPPGIEFKRAHLPDINPVGVGAMFVATTLALIAFSGVLGAIVQGLAGFIGLGAAFIAAPLIAYATRGRFYIARTSPPLAAGAAGRADGRIVCSICENPFEVPDMALCPAYGGPICSLCCTLDARCADRCKPGSGAVEQLTAGLKLLLPSWLFARLHSRLVHYAGVLSILCLMIAIMLVLVYLQVSIDYAGERVAVRAIFWEIFCILVIMAGVAAWLLVLAQESRSVAQEETQRQTALLMAEIAAHRRTDAELQRAKEVAEAANLAKTRYMVGISHELRSPLNAVFGYAQLLDRDPTIPSRRRNAIKVIRRSAEHMSGLIEGLLEISKIQAGRLDLQRNEVRPAEFLEQIVDMFRLQAADKGLDFRFHCSPSLPKVVYTDEKRLRQIVINLLSNAIKFTRSGHVSLAVNRLGEVSDIEVTDTGIGIHPDECQQIFEPFVQGRLSGAEGINGTGLGLTICKLLTEAMGGEISVRSTLGQGSQFKVRMLLPEVLQPARVSAGETPVGGYEGERLTILLADDDEDHRNLVNDLLQPLGFAVHAVADGPACLRAATVHHPDIVLLDISMPGMSGWEVASRLRQADRQRPRIVMLSGNASELDARRNVPQAHDATLTKPMNVQALLEIIAQLSPITWVPASQEADAQEVAAPGMVPTEFAQAALPTRKHLQDLYQLGDIGYVRGIREKLAEIAKQAPHTAPFIETLEAIVARLDLPRYMDILDRLLHAERR